MYPGSFSSQQPTMNSMGAYIAGPLLGGILAGLWSHFNNYVLNSMKKLAFVQTSAIIEKNVPSSGPAIQREAEDY